VTESVPHSRLLFEWHQLRIGVEYGESLNSLDRQEIYHYGSLRIDFESNKGRRIRGERSAYDSLLYGVFFSLDK
jgi:hypothetical protein